MYKEDFSKMDFLWLLCGQFGAHVMIWCLRKKRFTSFMQSVYRGAIGYDFGPCCSVRTQGRLFASKQGVGGRGLRYFC